MIIIINSVLFVFYAHGNYNYLWGIPGHLLTHSPEKVFRMFSYTWDNSYNLGGSRVVTHSCVLIAPLFIILHKILDPKFIYFLYKFLITTIAGISMFCFSKSIFREFNNIQNNQILPFLSAILYMFNPLTARWISSNIDLMTPYALTPVILYFLIKSASERKFLNTFLATIFLSITLLFNIGSIFVMLTLIILFVVLYSILSQKTEIIKNTFLALVISFLLTAWHIIPAAYHFLNNVGAWKSVGAMERFYSLRANIINTLGLINAWEMFASYNGYKIFYFSDIYKHFGILLLLMPIITFIPLLFLQEVRKNRHLVISVSFISIIGIVLAQGTNPSSPLSPFYKFLLENMPLFNAVRNSTKFDHLIVFSYSLLFPYSIFLLNKIINKKTDNIKHIGKITLFIVSIIALSIYSAPFWSGKLFNDYTTGIPNDVFSVSEYINHEKREGAVLILPGPWLSTYEWLHPYTSRSIYLSTIKENPIIFRYGGSLPLNVYARNFLEEFYKNFFLLQNMQILGLLRVKYLLVDETIDTSFYKHNTYPTTNISEINDYLKKRDDIKLVKKFGKITLYEYKGKLIPEIYVPIIYVYKLSDVSAIDIFYWNNVLCDKYNISLMDVAIGKTPTKDLELLETISEKINMSINSQNTNAFIKKNILLSAPAFEIYKNGNAKIINYTKINPTLWRVRVNATKPFMLSFAESYDPLWEARVYKDGKLVEKVSSIPLYGVINGFYINETGDLKIIIRYKPQDWFNIGLVISIITFLGCIVFLFYDWKIRKTI